MSVAGIFAASPRLAFSGRLRSFGLALFCGLLFFPGLGERDLTSSHEARAAQNAQTILDEGHWLVPRLFDRHIELQKPPLFYWLVALFAWLKGGPVDVWAVRLPAALSALGTVLFLHFLGQRSGRPRAGFFAALILATCLHFTWLARVGRIDMPLTFTVTLALGSFHLGNLPGAARIRWHALAYTAVGVGLLLKGPIAAVLPGLAAAAVQLSKWSMVHCHLSIVHAPRQILQSMARSTLWWGAPLVLAIAAPWYVWANLRTHNQIWEVFFWYHNVERGLGGSETLKAHPFWFYLPQACFDLLPWSLAAPFALYGFFRSRAGRGDDAARAGLLWFLAMLVFLSCMRFKRADYLLPAYPGLAIFLGASGERYATAILQKCFFALLAIYLIGFQAYAIAFLPAEEKAWPYRAMAEEIRTQTQGPVIFFRAETHLLMHHVGPPVDTILEWENLAWWADRPFPVYVVMPEKCAEDWPAHLRGGALEPVLRTRDYVHGRRDRPMVVLRSRPLK